MNKLHQEALEAAASYRTAEGWLIELLDRIDRERVFLVLGHSSLFQYTVQELKLSESVAYNLITVSRKARQIPELREAIKDGSVTLTNARKIVPVLTTANQEEWIQKASQLSQRELEKEIVRIRPGLATRERASYVTPTRLRLELGISEEGLDRLKQVQDLLSQSQQRAVTLEETVDALTKEYLSRHDPLQRARRASKRTLTPTDSVAMPVARPKQRRRTPRPGLPAELVHQVNLRDQRQCTHVDPKGKRCTQTRWLEMHHVLPVEQGGRDSVDNLVTLCTTHHAWIHSGTHSERNSMLRSSQASESCLSASDGPREPRPEAKAALLRNQ